MHTDDESEPRPQTRGPAVSRKAIKALVELSREGARQLHANTDKGNWDECTPAPGTLIMDLRYHFGKLDHAMQGQSDPARIREHCGDLANLLSKALAMYGEKIQR